jgi:hypothetical protein
MSQQTDKHIDQSQDRFVVRDRLQRQLVEAEDSLNREVYCLETAEISLRIAEEEIGKLESLGLSGLMASLTGTKEGRLDALRAKCEDLQREGRERARTVQTIEQQVAQIKQQIEALGAIEEPSTRSPADGGGQGEIGDCAASGGGFNAAGGDDLDRLERAVEAGESLLSQLGGTYGLCNRLRSGPSSYGRGGALFSAVMQTCRSRAANTVTGQITDSVSHFCNQVSQLGLDPEDAADAEVLAGCSQLQAFAEAGSGALDSKTEAWAELEILVRGLVSDLQESLARRAQHGR